MQPGVLKAIPGQNEGLTSTCALSRALRLQIATSTAMPTHNESDPSLKSSAKSSSLLPLPVFPPLPPLPPPDACKSPKSSRKAPFLSSTSAARSEPRPRRFGARITNMLSSGESSSSIIHKTDHKPPPSLAMAAAQRYYHHQYQSFTHLGKKSRVTEEAKVENNPNESADVVDKDESKDKANIVNESVHKLPTEDSPSIKPSEINPKKSPLQPERTIWSVTPDELTELAKEMTATKTGPVRKLSYAEASKRNLPGFAESRAAQKTVEVEVQQPVRTFKKYYSLPIIPSYQPSYSVDISAESLEEKDSSDDQAGSYSEKEQSGMLDYSQIFGLSADTPTFYPRQTTDTNDLIQVLKASLASKKVAPHMDWWPGDWKCTNCGNHNFSYRDTCKRCRVGRLEDAGFVFPPSSADSSTCGDKYINDFIS